MTNPLQLISNRLYSGNSFTGNVLTKLEQGYVIHEGTGRYHGIFALIQGKDNKVILQAMNIPDLMDEYHRLTKR